MEILCFGTFFYQLWNNLVEYDNYFQAYGRTEKGNRILAENKKTFLA